MKKNSYLMINVPQRADYRYFADVSFVFSVVHGDYPAVRTAVAGKDAYYISVFYTVLVRRLVIAAEDISVFVPADYAVKHEGAVVAFYQRDIVFLKRQRRFFQIHGVGAVAEHRGHADSG